jgi:hypothetical protein
MVSASSSFVFSIHFKVISSVCASHNSKEGKMYNYHFENSCDLEFRWDLFVHIFIVVVVATQFWLRLAPE